MSILLVVRQVLLLAELPDLHKDKTVRFSFYINKGLRKVKQDPTRRAAMARVEPGRG
jgi:hypothetical protein